MRGRLRFKQVGTGSAVPEAPQVTERPFQWARTDAVPGLLSSAVEDLIDPRQIAERGLPCFRWRGFDYSIDSELEIMVQGESRWQNLLTWWRDNSIGSEAELEALLAQLRIGSGNWQTQTTPTPMDFIFCAPYVAGNVILHNSTNPGRIVTTAGSPHLHVFRRWRTRSFFMPLTLSAGFDQATISGQGRNVLTVFVERPTDLAVEWENPPPESWHGLIGYSGSSEIQVGDWTYERSRFMSIFRHPWPDKEFRSATGIVAISSRNSEGEIINGFPAIPLAVNVGQTLTYLSSPESFKDVLIIPSDGAINWQPFRVWKNVNPLNERQDVSDFTTLDPLISRAVDNPSSRPGLYVDQSGTIIAANYTNTDPAYTNSAETAEEYMGHKVDRIGTVPIVRSEAEMAPMLQVERSGESATITSDYLTRLIKIYRFFGEGFVIPDGEGPELVVTVNTGSGGQLADEETDIATASFACVGFPNIAPANDAATRLWDAGKVTLRDDSISGKVVISFPFASEVEVDSEGRYYAFQTVEFRFRLCFFPGTVNSFLLYPTTAAIDAPKPIPEGPFIFNGYPFEQRRQ